MICEGENGTDGHHLAVYSVDVNFDHHFVATHLPSYPIGVLYSGIGYTSKKYLERQAIQLAIHSIVG